MRDRDNPMERGLFIIAAFLPQHSSESIVTRYTCYHDNFRWCGDLLKKGIPHSTGLWRSSPAPSSSVWPWITTFSSSRAWWSSERRATAAAIGLVIRPGPTRPRRSIRSRAASKSSPEQNKHMKKTSGICRCKQLSNFWQYVQDSR